MIEQSKSYDTQVIAGPCSIDLELEDNLKGIYALSEITVRNMRGETQRGLGGTRVVELKSKTILQPDGKTMGVGFNHYFRVEEGVIVLKNPQPEEPSPGAKASEQIVKDTGLLVATELMLPHIQLPQYEGLIPEEKFLGWQPSVEGLGYPHITIGEFVRRYNWFHGIKNSKHLDIPLDVANDPTRYNGSSLQRHWSSLASYAQNNRIIFIHRGVETPEKGEWRSALVHEIARATKHSVPGSKLYLDPSHSCGPNLRDKIVEESIKAMKMEDGNQWLYDGLLIESGNSITDTGQHITHDELRCLLQDLAKFRNLRAPEKIV